MIIIMSMIMLSLLLPASILLSFGPRLKIFQLTISSTSPSRWATSTWVWWFFAPTSSCALIEKNDASKNGWKISLGWRSDRGWCLVEGDYTARNKPLTPLLIANGPTRTLNGSHNSLVLLQWTCFFNRNWTDKCWYILGNCELFFSYGSMERRSVWQIAPSAKEIGRHRWSQKWQTAPPPPMCVFNIGILREDSTSVNRWVILLQIYSTTNRITFYQNYDIMILSYCCWKKSCTNGYIG